MRKLTVFLLIIIFLPVTALAKPSADQQLAQILNNLRSMQAQFQQTVQNGRGHIMQQSSGKMLLLRPGRFRWDTERPSPQLLIADGQKIWFYDAELQQVTVQDQHATHSGSPALLLDGSSVSLTRDFFVTNVSPSNNAQVFKLAPRKSDSLFQTVYLNFRQNQLQQMRLVDNLGQQTIITFTKVTVNPAINNSAFRFIPPKGVDVVEQ